jgi:hypothetical protein
MKTEQEIDALVRRAVEAGLDGLDFLSTFSYAELARGYNGIGPEFLPEWMRDLVSDKLDIFAPAALGHDMRNDVSDGTRASFLAANDEFRRNCLKLADLAYPQQPGVADDLKRARAKAVAEILYCFVSAEGFGWKAWLEAHERYLERRGAASHSEDVKRQECRFPERKETP